MLSVAATIEIHAYDVIADEPGRDRPAMLNLSLEQHHRSGRGLGVIQLSSVLIIVVKQLD